MGVRSSKKVFDSLPKLNDQKDSLGFFWTVVKVCFSPPRPIPALPSGTVVRDRALVRWSARFVMPANRRAIDLLRLKAHFQLRFFRYWKVKAGGKKPDAIEYFNCFSACPSHHQSNSKLEECNHTLVLERCLSRDHLLKEKTIEEMTKVRSFPSHFISPFLLSLDRKSKGRGKKTRCNWILQLL